MAHPADQQAWDDPSWREPSDSAWQARLRWQQCWWRSERLELPAGPHTKDKPDRLVGSTLPLDAPPNVNFLTREVVAAVDRRLDGGGGGLVSEDRLRRSLLSSQPMCFNLFGHFQEEANRQALLGWVRQISPGANEVTRVEIEWAPPAGEHFSGGSAFDAFVEYSVGDGLGFLGVECKYHEDLRKSDVKTVRDVYRRFTAESGAWQPGAPERLDRPGRKQLWLNTLLAQSLTRTGRYLEGRCVLTACAEDASARARFDEVREELVDEDDLVWQPWEEIVAAIDGHDPWRSAFTTRYLDFTPVQHLV